MKKNEYKDSKTEDLKNRALELFKACKLDMETLQASRAQSLKYYMGDKLGNEIKGRSQLRTTDLADVIEWIMPVLMKIFYGGQDVVTIRPQGPEDELKIKLMEGIVNFDLQKNNNGYKIFYQFFKDALLFKMGVVKYAWEKKVVYKHNDVEFDEAAFQALKSNPDYIMDEVEIIQESVIDASGMVTIPAEYRVVFRKKEKISKSVFWNIPPEEFIFDMTMKSVDDIEGFICHRRLISREHAKAVYDFTDEDMDAEIASFQSDDVIIQQRFKDLGGINFLTPSKDNSTVKIYVNECYLYAFDEEGNAIPKILTIIGNRVVRVEDNKYGKPPFCVVSPILMSHRMIGRAFEGVEDIQLARTALLRAIMENIYYTDNQVRVVNPNRINYADYKSGRIPGGTILTKGDIDPSTAIWNLPSTPLPASVFKMFETMLPELRADETGVTKYNQGLDSKSLNKMLDINTLVPMADGSVKKLKYIVDGDRIIGSGYKATTVITAHPIQYPKKAYEMMFANGDVIIAGGEHLWTIRASVDREKEWEIIDTDTIYEKFNKNKKIYVPLIGTKRKRGAEAQRIVSMKEVTIRPMRCLTVDAPDGLFAVGEYFTLTHNTASGINQIMSAAQQRVELIARTFAETGVKDLVQADIDMNIRFFDTERNLKIDNDWKLVTPDMIDGNYDAIIDVGIGTGSKEIQFNQVSMMFDKYAGIANVVKDPQLISQIFWLPQIKEMTKELWKFLGYKSPDRFLSPDQKLTQGDNGGGRRQENNRIPNSDGDRIPMVIRPSEYAEVS